MVVPVVWGVRVVRRVLVVSTVLVGVAVMGAWAAPGGRAVLGWTVRVRRAAPAVPVALPVRAVLRVRVPARKAARVVPARAVPVGSAVMAEPVVPTLLPAGPGLTVVLAVRAVRGVPRVPAASTAVGGPVGPAAMGVGVVMVPPE